MSENNGAGAGAGGGGGGDSTSAIFEGIDMALDGWYRREGERRQAEADDPCRWAVDTIQWAVGSGGISSVLTDAEQDAVELATAGARAVSRSILNWGRDLSTTVGEVPFSSYLEDRGIIRSEPIRAGMFLLGPWMLAIWDAAFDDQLLSRFPAAGHPPPGDNRGYRLGPGAYLYAGASASDATHIAEGRLQGSRVRSAFWGWRSIQRATVSPADHPSWRSDLDRLVGSTTGDWRIYRPGDVPQPGSRLAELRAAEARMLADVEAMMTRCEAAAVPPAPPEIRIDVPAEEGSSLLPWLAAAALLLREG